MRVDSRLAGAVGLQHKLQRPGARELGTVRGVPPRAGHAVPATTSLQRPAARSVVLLPVTNGLIVDTALGGPSVPDAVRQVDQVALGAEEQARVGHGGAPAVAEQGGQVGSSLTSSNDSSLAADERRDSSPLGPSAPSSLEDKGTNSSWRQQRQQTGARASSFSPPPARYPDSQGARITPPRAPSEPDGPLRTPEQQHQPPSAASSSSPFSSPRTNGVPRHHPNQQPRHQQQRFSASATGGRRHDELLSKIANSNNWYELRAVLLSSGAGTPSPYSSSSASSMPPDVVLAVLRRFAYVARYDMRPPESAALGSFLERWLLQHTLAALAHMGPYELSACLHSLAKLARALPSPPTAWTVAWFSAAQPYLLAFAFRPKDLSLSLWAFSRLQLCLPPAAVQLLLVAAEPHLPRFNAQDLSLVALALSALQARAGSGDGGSSGSESVRGPFGSGRRATAAALPSLAPSAAWRDCYLARISEVLREAGASGGGGGGGKVASGRGGGGAGQDSGVGPQALANLLHGLVRSGLLTAGPVAQRRSAPADGFSSSTGQVTAAEGAPSPSSPTSSSSLLLGDLCGALYSVLPECTPQGLANSLSALAAMGYAPEEGWVERFLAESAARMDGGDGGGRWEGNGGSDTSGRWETGGGGGGGGRWCNADDLSHLAAAVGELRLAPPRWWTARLYGAMERQLPHASPRQLSQMLHGVAQLHNSAVAAAAAAAAAAASASSACRERGAQAAAAEPPWEDPAEETAAALVTAAASAARPPPSLLAAWHRAAAAALPGFNVLDASHSLWALATLGDRPPLDWLQRLLVGVRQGLPGAPPEELALLLWSLAALRFRPTWSWMADCVEATTPGLARMNGQDYAMLTSSLVRLGNRPSPQWTSDLLAALRPQISRLELRPLAQTAWALYRLRVQPPPEVLEELAGELRRRWLAQAAEDAASVDAGAGGEAARASHAAKERLRHSATLLWVMAKWLGTERGSGRSSARSGGEGRKASLLQQRQRALAAQPDGSAEEPSQAADAPLQVPATPVAASTVDAASAAFTPADSASTAAASPVARIKVRMSGRMLRRRRSTRPGHLVASQGGGPSAADAVRRRITDQIMGPAMAATQPLLAAGAATAVDAALLTAALRAMPRAARRAAAAQPGWAQALLAATAPMLASLTPTALHQLLAAVGTLRDAAGCVDRRWAAAAARTAATHMAAPASLPAAAKVGLLRHLCALQVEEATEPVMAEQQGPAVAAAAVAPGRMRRSKASGSVWVPVLAGAVAAMRRTSGVREPLAQLQVELLKARVRLRKLAAAAEADAAAGSGSDGAGISPAARAAFAAAVPPLSAAQAVAASAATGAVCDAAALAAASEQVRAAVVSVSAVVAPPPLPPPRPQEDAHDLEELEDRPQRGRQPKQQPWGRMRVPPISEDQREWIWVRARRTVAAQVVESSPVAVAQLAQVAAAALAAAATALTTAEGSANVTQQQLQQLQQADPMASLLWLARICHGSWRRMLPVHRRRTERAWRAALAALTPGARVNVAAELPPSMAARGKMAAAAAATAKSRGRRRGTALGKADRGKPRGPTQQPGGPAEGLQGCSTQPEGPAHS